LLVRKSLAGGAAQSAGIRGLSQSADGDIVLGDIITTIDGEKMSDSDDLYRFLDKKQIGDTIQVGILRNGRTMTVPVKLLPLPQSSLGRPVRRS